MRRLLPPPDNDNDKGEDIDVAQAFAVPDGDHLRALFVASADGAAAADGASGGLGGDEDRRLLLTLRSLADAVVVGAGTVKAENYGGVKLDDPLRLSRQDAGRPATPPVVIISNRMDFDPGARVFVDTNVAPIVVTTEQAAESRGRDLAGLADVLPAGRDRVDLRAALGQLRERGLHQLQCEGGPTLFGALAAADLVDELTLTIAPLLAGGGAGRIVQQLPVQDPPRRMTLRALFHGDDGYLFARYALR